MKQCFLGWSKDNGNSKGRCCCNCKYQVKIMRHPWNTFTGGRMKGPITQIAGWGCTLFCEDNRGIVFFEQEHSVCEEHQFEETS